MRTTLSNFLKSETLEESGYLAGLQDWDGAHVYAT